jgi:hypothetical protein
MSKPLTASKSSGAPFRLMGRPIVSTPPFGGFWMKSMLLVGSRTYWVVTPPVSDCPKLFVYAAPLTPVEPPGSPLIAVSGPIGAPVFGLIRKFRPVFVTTRMRSTVGLKSKP